MTLNKDTTFGIEIEQFGCTRPDALKAIREALTTHGYTLTDEHGTPIRGAQGHLHYYNVSFVSDEHPDRRTFIVKSDQSIDGGEYDFLPGDRRAKRGGIDPTVDACWEIACPPMHFDEIPLAQTVLRNLNFYGARVNNSCGLHGHIGVDKMTPRQLVNLCRLAYKYDPLLIAAFQIDEERLNGIYVQPVKRSFVDGVNRYWSENAELLESRYLRSIDPAATMSAMMFQDVANLQRERYRTINFGALAMHGTVEFRLFDGTMHAGRLKTAIHTVYGMYSRACRVKNVRNGRIMVLPNRAKHDMNIFGIHAGFAGPEFKTTRKFLKANLGGQYNGRRLERIAWGITAPTADAMTPHTRQCLTVVQEAESI